MADPVVKTDEQVIFEEFNITDPEQQTAVKVRAAAHALAQRKNKPTSEEKPSKGRLW